MILTSSKRSVYFLLLFTFIFLLLSLPALADSSGPVTFSSLTPLQKQFYWICFNQNCAASSSWNASSPGQSCSSFCLNAVSQLTASTCSDPDLLDFFTKSEVTVSASLFTKKWEDQCYTFSSGRTYLLEYICTNNNYGYRQVDCSTLGKNFVCDRGRCLSSILNVKDFGALGDGVNDDGAAFQKALDTAPLDKQKVFIPAGTYFIDRTLLVHNDTEIYGDGEESILLRGNTKSFVPMFSGMDNCEKISVLVVGLCFGILDIIVVTKIFIFMIS